MKVYHYIYSWMLTLLVGLILTAMFGGAVSLMVTAIAALLSAPFMAIFCILMFFYLKNNPSKIALHQRTFLYHLAGSVLTVLFFTLAIDEILPIGLYAGIFGYFVVDSLFFHSYIERKHGVEEIEKFSDDDLLDSPVDTM